MNAFDKLRSVLLSIASSACQGVAYEKNWGLDFAHKEIKREWEDLDAPLRLRKGYTVTASDFFTMTDDEKRILGFARWDGSGLWLIPLYAFHYIANGETLTCIKGQTAIKGTDDIDLDVRCGRIAYGFKAQ